MVNRALLESYIDNSGKKKTHIAAKANMSVQTFNRKLKNEFDFSVTEVMKICRELGISSKEMEKIFFNQV